MAHRELPGEEKAKKIKLCKYVLAVIARPFGLA